jgi:hypothetical protein
MLQWSHLRSCMFLLDAEEQDKHFGLVLKLRDDSFALRPWLIPASWAQRGLTSLRCMQWGGVMDSTFAVGRRWAWTIMEGLAADWYISHYAVSAANLRIPHNPESWLARLAKLKRVPVQEKALCKLPFVSVRFVNNNASAENTEAPGLVVKRRHYQAARYDDACWATPSRNGSGGWSNCAGAESMRTTLESLKMCPQQLCSTR